MPTQGRREIQQLVLEPHRAGVGDTLHQVVAGTAVYALRGRLRSGTRLRQGSPMATMLLPEAMAMNCFPPARYANGEENAETFIGTAASFLPVFASSA